MILDLSKKQHVPLINMYKKCKGIALVDKYLPQLTPLNKMYVIDSLEDWEQVESEFPVTMMTARCDCPKGVNGKLPSGQTFNRDREMCLGKATHESWNIPWSEVPFMKDSAITKYKTSEISQEGYIETAKERIAFLVKAFPDRADEIFETMPKRYKGISRQAFRDVRDQVIFPLWMQHEQLLRDGLGSFGVEVNIVEDGTLVPMEIQVQDRFKEKNINSNER